MIYFCVFCFISLTTLLDNCKKAKYWKVVVCLFILLLFILISGLRWNTGTDWNSYYKYYTLNNSWVNFFDGSFENGYSFLSYLFKSWCLSYTSFLFFFALLVIVIKFYAIKDISVYFFSACLLNFSLFFADIFFTRQSLAISLTLLSTIFIRKKNPIFFCVFVFLASLFHITALCYILAYPIYYIRFSTRKLVVFLVSCFIIGLFFDQIFLFFMNFFSDNSSTSRIVGKLLSYKIIASTRGGSSLFAYLRKLFPVFLILLCYKKIVKKNINITGYINLYLFGIGLYFVFIKYFIDFQRLCAYFGVFEIVVIPLFTSLFPKKQKIFIQLIFILYCAVSILLVINGMYGKFYLPYFSIFSNNLIR